MCCVCVCVCCVCVCVCVCERWTICSFVCDNCLLVCFVIFFFLVVVHVDQFTHQTQIKRSKLFQDYRHCTLSKAKTAINAAEKTGQLALTVNRDFGAKGDDVTATNFNSIPRAKARFKQAATSAVASVAFRRALPNNGGNSSPVS